LAAKDIVDKVDAALEKDAGKGLKSRSFVDILKPH
jgi:hypothetical protein